MSDPYPFAGRYFDAGGCRMHYLDEGSGPAVVMAHGNPTWSFYYRNLITTLRGRFRCVAPDHVGMGLSDKPAESQYPYTLRRRVDDFGRLMDDLQLEDISLVVHDWGGMIGLAWAVAHPGRVKRLVILNTAAFGLPPGEKLPRSLWWARTPLGPLLVRGLNAFCLGAARWGVTRRPLPAGVRRQYLAPYDSWKNRLAVLKFVQTIPLRPADDGYDIVRATADGLASFRGKPVLICWGMRDFVFTPAYLAEWRRRLPAAEVHEFSDSGHYLLEDAGPEVAEQISRFLAG